MQNTRWDLINRMKKLISLIFIQLFIASYAFGGIELDSLKVALGKVSGKEKVDVLLRLSRLEQYMNSNESLNFAVEAFKLAQEVGDYDRAAKAYVSAGIILRNTGKSDKALSYFFKAVDLSDKAGNVSVKADAYHKISVAYLLAKDFGNALKYGRLEEGLWREIKDQRGMSRALNSLGLIMINRKNYDEAEGYLKESLGIAKKLKEDALIYKPMLNLGDLYLSLNQPDKALEYFKESTLISTRQRDTYGVAVNMLKKGEAHLQKEEFEEAITAAHAAKKASKKINSLALTRNAYQTLAKIYEAYGDFENALKFNKLYISSEDSMMDEVTKREIASIESEFAFERQELELERMAQEASKRSIQTITLLLIVALTSALAVVLFNRGQLKRKSHEEMISKNEEIIKQAKLLSEQTEALSNQNQELIEANAYASMLQTLIYAKPPSFLNIFTDYFVYQSPKNVSSGDFCWFAHRSDSVFVAVGDCTGYGVKGALNTAVVHHLLNQIIYERTLSTPSDILKELHHKIRKLSTPFKEQFQDFRPNVKLGICQINVNSKRMTYAGSRIPLFFLQNGKVKRVKADTHSVVDEADITFQNQIIQLQKGDKFLMLTDGFQKQVGSDALEVYSEEQLHTTLGDLAPKGLPLIRQQIEEEFLSWKEDQAQTDDVLIFGLQV